MRLLFRIGLTLLWLVPVMGSVLAADFSPATSSDTASSLQLAQADPGDAPEPPAAAAPTLNSDQAWKDVRKLIRDGSYREALQIIDIIQAANPDDPRARLYAALCRARLTEDNPFPQLERDELRSLEDRLRRENRDRKKANAEIKAINRRIKKEQESWDRDLKAAGKETKEQARLRRQQEESQAIEEAKTRRERLIERAKQLTPVPAAPIHDMQATEPGTPPEAGSATGVPQGAALRPTPSLLAAKRVPPPGAVQIDARQMSVSPDRRVARAEGNVEIIYGDALMTCDKLTFFTDTKDVYAEGNVRLEEGDTVFRGEMVHYNFENKKGRFLQGTVSAPPWHQHGRSIEHLAEGIYQVTPGYITSCELEPPHFRFAGRKAIVFAEDKVARAQNVALFVERVPFLYFPGLVLADRQSPFYVIPGKKKPWEEFLLGGYRYEYPENHKGTVHVDYRRAFHWGFGLDHQFESEQFGKGLLKVYYNEEGNQLRPEEEVPKGAEGQRYRLLWRHRWAPLPDTSIVTDVQEFSDADFRREFLFREEFVEEDATADPGSFISAVRNDPNFTMTGLVRKRMNRFESVEEAFPDASIEVREQPIGDTNLYSRSTLGIANLQSTTAHSDNDTDVVRADWWQQFKYGLNLFRPVLMTPNASVRQTYYNKDIQSGTTGRLQGERDVIAGQFTAGTDASVKFFKMLPVSTNFLGLNVNMLRHVMTPTVTYQYVHEATVPNELLNFASAAGPSNIVSVGIENKIQTKRVLSAGRKPQSVDLARALLSVPYEFHGRGNDAGGEMGDWLVDIELYPWPWLRMETDWIVPSHFSKSVRDDRIERLNLDLVMVGGKGDPLAQSAAPIQAPMYQAFQPGPQPGITLLPQGQWYFGLGHRYSQNDKTEEVVQFDWRLSDKWQIGSFHRFTLKEVAPATGDKRFNHMREYQYTLRRDLHDWIGELAYRVDSEFGTEVFFTLTLKAYPLLPIEVETSYRQPKYGSRYSPFSPVTP